MAELERRDPRLVARIRAAITAYAASGHGDVKKLRGSADEWRLRVGGWRVIFSFVAPAAIAVRAVAPRREIYRR